MYKSGKYRNSDKMASLVCDNYFTLPIITRFGIKLGFADKTIEQVCVEYGVDTTTFLAVVNVLLRCDDLSYESVINGVIVKDVLCYLHSSHVLYLNSTLPKIRKKLHSALGDDKISSLIMCYFDDYVEQIKEHLCYEEDTVFPYIESLTQGSKTSDYSITDFSARHDHIDEPLEELKNIIIKYYNSENSDAVAEVIHDLLSCAKDIAAHNIIEDRLLVPIIRKIESNE